MEINIKIQSNANRQNEFELTLENVLNEMHVEIMRTNKKERKKITEKHHNHLDITKSHFVKNSVS